MSTGLANDGENALLRGNFRTSGGLPTTVYLALTTTGTIGEATSMSGLAEPSSGDGYARIALSVPSDIDWPTIGQSYVESRQVQWSPQNNDWTGLQHIVLCGSASGDGPIYGFRPLTGAPVSVVVGQSLLSTFRLSLE